MKAILTKYHGPGNIKGSGITAKDSDGNRAHVGYDDSLSSYANHYAAACALCDKLNWNGKGSLVGGGIKDGMAFVFVPELDDLAAAASALLAKIDNITSDEFSKSAERDEREALRRMLGSLERAS